MPIVYIFLVCTFIVTYWVDKLTVLRIYRKPPRYGKSLTKITREWLNLAIFLHFILSFWMYSNSAIFDTDSQNLFGWGSSSKEKQVKDEYSWIKINDKINQYHCFAYLLAFGLFILCFIFKTLVFNFLFKTCLSSCKKSKLRSNDLETQALGEKDEAYSNNFFHNLEKEHLERIISKTKTEIEVYEDLTGNEEHGPAYQAVKGDLEWYVNRMKEMVEEMEKELQNEDGEKGLYVGDHSYDIREIRPY